MGEAGTLYASLGFTRCAAYYEIPLSFRPYTVFMDLDLTAVNRTAVN